MIDHMGIGASEQGHAQAGHMREVGSGFESARLSGLERKGSFWLRYISFQPTTRI